MKSDIPIRRLLQIKPEDWVSFLFPEINKISLEDMPTDMVSKTESRMDNVKKVNDTFISHIEPNGYLDHTLPGRMLRYRADIWEYTLNKNKETPPVSQTVILFFEKHDNKVHNLHDAFFDGQMLDYQYRVVKAWEIDPQDIIDKKLAGLYPLLPIIKYENNKTGDEILKESVNIIDTVEDKALRADLLSVMSILANEKHSHELIKKYIRREQLMESALFKEWVEEFVIEGEKRGEERGEKRGVEKQQLYTAKKLLARGMSYEEIKEITKLPIKKIMSLK